MINWLVTWIVVSCFCVPGSPLPDDYGRIIPAAFAVCNMKCINEPHDKLFESEIEALRFIVGGEDEEDLKNFTIEPVYK